MVVGSGRRLEARRDLAVLEDRHPVGEPRHLAHAVGDVDDRRAAGLDPVDGAEQELAFLLVERRGRLVHHHHLGVERDRLGDLDHLLAGDVEVRHQRVGVDADVEEVEHAARLGAHSGGVDDAAARRLAAEEDVLRHRSLGQQRELLVDHRDADPERLHRVGEGPRLAAEAHLAGVGPKDPGEDLDQRRLAGAVLADERMRLAGAAIEADVAQRVHAAERLRDVRHLDDRRGAHARLHPARTKASASANSVSRSGNSGRHTRVAAAISGSPWPKASTVIQPS